MSLNNVELTNGTLTAKGINAEAVSELITQSEGETDFESVRECKARFLLNNICDNILSTEDTCVTSSPIVEGDRIFIVDDAGDIHDTVVGVVDNSDANVIPVMTSNTAPSGVCSSSYDGTNAFKAFNNNNGSYNKLHKGDNVAYQFANNEPKLINRYIINNGYAPYSRYITEFRLEGSINGTDWTTLSVEHPDNSTIQKSVLYTVQSPGEYSHYRIVVVNANYSDAYIYSFMLLKDDGSSFDTSGVTNGAVPKKVFRYEDKVKINNVELQEKNIYYEYGSTGSKLFVFPTFQDVSVTGRSIETTVDFSAPENECKEISGKIFKLV